MLPVNWLWRPPATLSGDAIKAGKGVVPESIVIADADGQEQMSVPLKDALPDRFRD